MSLDKRLESDGRVQASPCGWDSLISGLGKTPAGWDQNESQ